MKAIYRLMRALALVLAPMAIIPQAHSAEPKLPRDGWVSWQVAAVDNARGGCCWRGWKGDASSIPCALDTADGFGVSDRDTTTDTVKVYARTSGGALDRLQVLSASCAVETRTPIQELAGITVDDSARWLIVRARESGVDAQRRRSIGENAMAALAMHRGDVAGGALAAFARDPAIEMRKSAVFWLALYRGSQGTEITSSVMFNDKEAEVRKHAAFALAQTKSPRAAADLIRQGNTDKVGDVRAKAWFWLAQTGAADAEQAIAAASKKDADHDVREEAIFALSQLPDERATRALIAAAEDQSLSREQRKRAVFWLAQSESDAAQRFLEQVLTRTSASRRDP